VQSQLLINKFKAQDKKALAVTYNEIKAVTWAGLCHDLGHGPFSHVFDNEFLDVDPAAHDYQCVPLHLRQKTRASFTMHVDPRKGRV
jgi:HD superfamily phosphohydrolase